MLKEYLDVFIKILLNDIVVYNKILEEYVMHVNKVLYILLDAYLKIKLTKIRFHV